jgi:hypothetical protein
MSTFVPTSGPPHRASVEARALSARPMSGAIIGCADADGHRLIRPGPPRTCSRQRSPRRSTDRRLVARSWPDLATPVGLRVTTNTHLSQPEPRRRSEVIGPHLTEEWSGLRWGDSPVGASASGDRVAVAVPGRLPGSVAGTVFLAACESEPHEGWRIPQRGMEDPDNCPYQDVSTTPRVTRAGIAWTKRIRRLAVAAP